MLEILESYGFVDDQIRTVDWINANLDFVGRPVYEVVRLIDSVPLFFEDHMKRLENSCRIVGLENRIDANGVRKGIDILARNCKRTQGNLKIVYGELSSEQRMQLLIVFIPCFYPGPELYNNGVAATLLQMERPNPQAKLIKEKPKGLQEMIDVEAGFYEILMVNVSGKVTEGSRSNVFMIAGDSLVTAPDEDVLSGITRDKVLAIAKERDIDLQFESIKKEKLAQFDSVFLTGTSPGVLPVRSVNELTFDVRHPLLRKIMSDYQQMVKDDILVSGQQK